MPDDAGFSADHGFVGPTWVSSAPWDPDKIPPRPWIAPGYLLRGAVTAIVGVGGISKSMLMLAWAVALAMGRKYHRMHPTGRHRVVVYNCEDDDDEQKRRLSAVLISMGLTPAHIADKVMRTGPTKVGALLARDPDSKELYRTAAMQELVLNLRAFKPDVVILDPMAELHTEDENANVPLREVVAEFRALAKELEMAIVLVHHTRKGVVVPGDMDAARGASSVVSAARVGLTIVGMTEEDEKALGLGTGTRQHYFRLDGGKANYSPLTECEWFERDSYMLDQGDSVGVPKPWEPPQDSVTPELEARIEAIVRRGSPTGPWSPKLENRPRSIKHALVEAGIVTQPGQKELLAKLISAGFITERFRDANRKWAHGLRAPDGMPDVEWFEAGQGEV